MDLIQKYVGSEGREPRLNKLGGTEWVRTKTGKGIIKGTCCLTDKASG